MTFLEKHNWACGLLGYAESPSEVTDHKLQTFRHECVIISSFGAGDEKSG